MLSTLDMVSYQKALSLLDLFKAREIHLVDFLHLQFMTCVIKVIHLNTFLSTSCAWVSWLRTRY
ncbi:hypothetical protein SASPL_153520 [Salvia splendens]|uniref:Uncharacterized protein n=1 Tax=Salvia splendens TaxID=180675 RepID=A0A8X8YYE4_SALSN|nr:hypothetical protein SASPL_153520 [Salvia splendens]